MKIDKQIKELKLSQSEEDSDLDEIMIAEQFNQITAISAKKFYNQKIRCYDRFSQLLEGLLTHQKRKTKPRLAVIDSYYKHEKATIETIKLARMIHPSLDIMVVGEMNPRYKPKIPTNDLSGLFVIDFENINEDLFPEIQDYCDFIGKNCDRLFSRYFSKTLPKLFVIAAPPGYGKSTIIKDLRMQNINPLIMLTTRQPRSNSEIDSGEKEFVSKSEFDYLIKHDKIMGVVKFEREQYGFLVEDIEAIQYGRKHFVVPMSDYRAIARLKQDFPDIVRIIHLNPTSDFAGYGLEKRLAELKEPSFGFCSFQEELEHIKTSQNSINDTKIRLESSRKKQKEADKYRQHFDYEIKSTYLEQITQQILTYIFEELVK